MPFSEASITSISAPVWQGADLEISWTSSSPQGTIFQLYVDRSLVYGGTNRFAVIPMPAATITIDVGTVLPGETNTNFSADLPPIPETRATLAWFGGTFESPEISGFYVYSGDTAGASVDYGSALANIPAYTGPPTDGFGLGPFGVGGFGESAGSYSWVSAPLASGTWNFAVSPYDVAGNVGTAATVSVPIVAPPIEPAPYGDMSRLRYSYVAATQEAILTWNASPSA